jgi:methionyl aminopeptidase
MKLRDMSTPMNDRVESMREGGKILAEIVRALVARVEPGVTTNDLNDEAERLCKQYHVLPAFKGYEGYPKTLCVGRNDVVVHGIPDDQTLVEGDIISIDMGVIHKGLYTDMARTVGVGTISDEAQQFLNVVQHALENACVAACIGNTIGDISYAICSTVEPKGYSVVRQMVGHAVGKNLHEDPYIPGIGKPGTGSKLLEGQTLAIEAIINQGTPKIVISREDGWTSRTKDGKLSALFENTVLVSTKSEILTPL